MSQGCIPVVENEADRLEIEREHTAVTSAEDRYRTLLGASRAVADQPTVKAVLQSMREILSGACSIHGAELYLESEDGSGVYSFAFDRPPDAPAIPIGAKVLRSATAAKVLDEQIPVFVPDLAHEMRQHPDFAPFAAQVEGRSTYLFPVSTSQKKYGILSTPKLKGQEFTHEDVDLLRSVAAHVAVALECALARDAAEVFEQQASEERDRLKLLLEINNHIVTKLDVDELFHAVSSSMRRHFDNELTSVWLLNKPMGVLERRFFDFPTGKGILEKLTVTLPAEKLEKFEVGGPQFHWPSEADFPAEMRAAARAESLVSNFVMPLIGMNGPLGLLGMASRKPNAFDAVDRDLLAQIGTQISVVFENALAYGRLRASNEDLELQRLYLEEEISSEFNFGEIVGNSKAIQDVMKQVAIVAPTDSTVLLHGETGTGKELVARAIHRGSPRRERTFVKLNCAAIPSGLLESELFGHEKGAFTGALMQKKGRFEVADRGTLFLDEIGDISMELQPKLLRAVQEQEFERLGSTRTVEVDVRMIAATHRDLGEMIRNNQFREDLFYRLNVFPIEIPPLRERPEDIPMLVHYFTSRLARRMQKKIKTIPKHAMEVLTKAPWPGNVRELENFIERAVILTQGSELNVPVAELKSTVRKSSTQMGSTSAKTSGTFEDAERQAIIDALKAAAGKVAGEGGAAGRLGLKRTTLQNKMRRLSISRADYAG